MKKLLLATAVSFAASTAFAGGLSEAVTDPVVTAPAVGPSWAGFYVGADIGYAINGATLNHNNPADDVHDLDGAVGGLQVGYLWEGQGNLVFGVEADLTLKGPSGYWRDDNQFSGYWAEDSIDQSLEVKAKLGVTEGKGLFYGFVGGIAAKTSNSFGCDVGLVRYVDPNTGNKAGSCASNPARVFSDSNSSTATGWVAGIGAEFALKDGWSAKIEYTHTDLGTTNVVLQDPHYPALDNRNFDTSYDVITVGVNYRF